MCVSEGNWGMKGELQVAAKLFTNQPALQLCFFVKTQRAGEDGGGRGGQRRKKKRGGGPGLIATN